MEHRVNPPGLPSDSIYAKFTFGAGFLFAALRDVIGRPDFPTQLWSYPPPLLLLIRPLELLGYLSAYALWCAAGLALYLEAARYVGVSSKYMLFLAAAPAVGVDLWFDENGFITAALLIGGLASLLALLRQRGDNMPLDHLLIFAMWALPIVMMPFAAYRIPLSVPVLPAFAARLLWRLSRTVEHRAIAEFAMAPSAVS
jgi:hypothetical protein